MISNRNCEESHCTINSKATVYSKAASLTRILRLINFLIVDGFENIAVVVVHHEEHRLEHESVCGIHDCLLYVFKSN